MNAQQPSTSKITRAATLHLCDAAHSIERRHDLEAARLSIVDAAFEVLGDDPHLPVIVDLLLRAMTVQHDACRNEIL
jgi:hypothetical protein